MEQIRPFFEIIDIIIKKNKSEHKFNIKTFIYDVIF